MVEVGDMMRGEALEYLDRRTIPKNDAEKICDFVGGRIIHLKSVADQIKDRYSFEGISYDI